MEQRGGGRSSSSGGMAEVSELRQNATQHNAGRREEGGGRGRRTRGREGGGWGGSREEEDGCRIPVDQGCDVTSCGPAVKRIYLRGHSWSPLGILPRCWGPSEEITTVLIEPPIGPPGVSSWGGGGVVILLWLGPLLAGCSWSSLPRGPHGSLLWFRQRAGRQIRVTGHGKAVVQVAVRNVPCPPPFDFHIKWAPNIPYLGSAWRVLTLLLKRPGSEGGPGRFPRHPPAVPPVASLAVPQLSLA